VPLVRQDPKHGGQAAPFGSVQFVPHRQALANMLDGRMLRTVPPTKEVSCQATRHHPNDADTHQHEGDRDNSPGNCPRCDITVSDGRHCDHCPPECLTVTTDTWLNKTEDRTPEKDDTARDRKHIAKPILARNGPEFTAGSPEPHAGTENAEEADKAEQACCPENIPRENCDQLDYMFADKATAIGCSRQPNRVVCDEDDPDSIAHQLSFG